MKTIKQLLRQPLKTLLGVILMTLAVAVLCVCVGQALAAQTTKQQLDERFSTVAVPSMQEEFSGVESILVDEEMIAWLQNGGEAIVHCQGDKSDRIGLFSHRGHYILATAMVDDKVQILDPSDKPEKYEIEGRKGKVRKEEPFLYVDPKLVDEACYDDRIHFHMFKKK